MIIIIITIIIMVIMMIIISIIIYIISIIIIVTKAARSTNVTSLYIANGKSLFVIVNSHIRKRKSYRQINFKQHVNIQRLLVKQAH